MNFVDLCKTYHLDTSTIAAKVIVADLSKIEVCDSDYPDAEDILTIRIVSQGSGLCQGMAMPI